MKTKQTLQSAFFLSQLLALSIPASAAVLNWTNTAGGYWSAATNWHPNSVPATSDAVLLTNAGNYTITQDLHVTLASLTLGGTDGTQSLTNPGYNLTLSGGSFINTNGVLGFANGTLATTGPLTVGGRCVWGGGNWAGPILVAIGGTLDLTGNLDKGLSGSLTNQGTITWSGVHTLYLAGSRIHNLAGGVFNIQNNQNILLSSGLPTVINAGTIRKSSGGGMSVIAVPLINSGALDVQSGGVSYWAGSQFNDGTAFLGAGTNAIYTGTISFNGAVASENLLIASDGSLNLAGTCSLSGAAHWTGGTISGAMTIASNGTLHISGIADRALTGSLNNRGALIWSGANTLFLGNSRLTNSPDGRFDIQNNQNILAASGAPVIHNAGTIRKSGGGAVSVMAVPLINSGTLDVQAGSLNYWGGSRFETGSAFTGAGTNAVYTGIVTFNGALTSENLLIASDGTLNLAGTHTLNGTARWTGGTISGAMTIASNSTLNISGTADHAVSGSLNNQGTLVWSEANTIYLTSGYITNLAGGLVEIQNNQNLLISSGLIHNRGTIRKRSGGGISVLAAPLINSGTLEVQSGNVGYWGGSQFNSGTAFTGAGTNTVYTGTVTFNGALTSENLEIASDGTLNLAGTHTLNGTARWTGGTISGAMTIATNGTLNIAGTADRALSGSLNNQGLIVWSGENNVYVYNAPITNAAGAVFEIHNNQVFSLYNGAQKFHNRGTIRKSAGAGDTFITVPMLNTGTLEVQSGRIAYGAGCQFNAGTVFTGAGTNLVYSGSATFNGAIASENLELASDGTLAFGGNCTWSGVVNWTAGTLADDSAFTIAPDGTLNIRGTADRSVIGSLTNLGVITWSGAHNIDARLTARIVNEAGGLLDIQNNQWLSLYNGLPRVINNGILRKRSSTGDTIITVPVINAGTLEVQSGRIAYGPGGQFNSGSSFTGPGVNVVYAGLATFNGAIASANLEFGGATILGTNTFSGTVRWTAGDIGDSTHLTIATNCTLHITGTADHAIYDPLVNAGQIVWSGANTVYFMHTGTISNLAGGMFEAQADGVLAHGSGVSTFRNAGVFRKAAGTGNTTISLTTFQNTGTVDAQAGQIVFGNYTHSGGKISCGLNSLTNFGRLAFANPISFNGMLGVNLNDGYAPVAGDAFPLITYPSRTGAFADFQLPASHAWQTNASIYGATAITLTVLNSRPASDLIPLQTGDEETAITFTATASDPDPGHTWTFGLLDAPAGSAINPNTGFFVWTPTEAQGPATNVFAIQVTDNGTPPMSATQNVTLVVREVNRAPIPKPLQPATVAELVPFVWVTNLAADPDLPPNTLTYTLLDAPEGMAMDEHTGAMTWTPSELQGPATNLITLRITDDGSPARAATNTFTLEVLEVNSPPVLAPLAACTHVAGAMCWITNVVTDSDLPTQRLRFSLLHAPPGMVIGPTSGLLLWAPPPHCPPLTNTVTVQVTDDGSPPLMAEQSFGATLITIPRLRIANAGDANIVLAWPAEATAAGFALQSTTSLPPSSVWADVPGTPVIFAGDNHLTNQVNTTLRAYRLASPLAPLPTLTIATTATNTTLVTWPTNAVAFFLQVAPGFQPPQWADATNAVNPGGSASFITDPQTGSSKFYRLRMTPLP